MLILTLIMKIKKIKKYSFLCIPLITHLPNYIWVYNILSVHKGVHIVSYNSSVSIDTNYTLGMARVSF
jgi:hypothetical protein